jgi:hypothetical protein
MSTNHKLAFYDIIVRYQLNFLPTNPPIYTSTFIIYWSTFCLNKVQLFFWLR